MTTPTQLEIECALISGAADDETRGTFNKFPVPAGYTLYDRRNLDGGFDVDSYKNGNTIVIAFAPTNAKEWCDIFTDVVLGLGGADKQLMQAAEYYMYIKSLPENEGAEIIFTGHSLGGGLAALMAVFFDKNAVAFDQAPFERAANLDVAVALKNYLINAFPANTYPQISDWLAPLNSYINSYGDLFSSRENNVTNINVLGEILSPLAAFRIGTEANTTTLQHGASADTDDLHSQVLLAAFLLDDDFRQVTYKLTDVLEMIFDSKLYYNDPNNKINPNENFLERLVRHEVGVTADAANGIEAVTDDNMLTRFTNDLIKIAQEGGGMRTRMIERGNLWLH